MGGLGVLNQRIANRDQIRAAIVRQGDAHSLPSWLPGSAPAAVVLAVYALWLRLQLRTVALGLLYGVVIIGLAVLVARGRNGVFEALRLGRLRIPGFYREWARSTPGSVRRASRMKQ